MPRIGKTIIPRIKQSLRDRGLATSVLRSVLLPVHLFKEYRAAIEPARFRKVLASLQIAFHDYTFIDFGSGKGRALLLASEFPFKRIIGLEFSPELHGTQKKILRATGLPFPTFPTLRNVVIYAR